MDNERSGPRVAIVTGGSRGIGRACVERLAADGYRVAINYMSRSAEAQAAVEAAAQAGTEAIAVQADIADEAAVESMFETAAAEFGGVDVVVHAAGRMDLAPLAELDLDVLDQMHRTNIRGTFVVGRQAVRRLRPGGSIVNFSSSVIGLAFPGYSAYAASKGAVEAMTLTMASELRGRDITVNAVAPGPIATALFLDNNDEERISKLAAQPPLERLGTPEDIAAVVAFLTSPQGHWVNGQVLRANGGLI
ncbi:MAG TPA: SDR family oxidoreductase [Solirubrobacterales bacterium]